MNPEDKVTYFAESDYRNKRTKFGIKASDRTRHVYVIGKTGMGKSTLLKNMAVQDIQQGNGICFIDPHGDLAEALLDYVPDHRVNDVLYFAPFDLSHPISFNVMEDVDPDKRYLVANGLMSAFKKIWVDAWSARMEYILNNILLALLEYPDSTLIGVNRMLADKTYRKRVVSNIQDVSVKGFWEDEFAKYGDRYMQEAGAAIQNKIGQFVSNPLVRNIIGQPGSSFDTRKIMDESKIMIVNLSKGRVGEDNANLIGSMLITKIYLAAMSRAEVPAREAAFLPNFYFYVDEFQNFANESFAHILSEARKYKLNLTIAHQYIEQMTDEVRAAVFGNVGTMITFRVGATDAEYLEKEFSPEFTMDDLVNLGFAQIYLRLMIDGIGSKPFSAITLPSIPELPKSNKEKIIERSREQFAKSRSEVEETIIAWHESHAGVVSEEGKKKILASYRGEGEWEKPAKEKKSEQESKDKNYSQNMVRGRRPQRPSRPDRGGEDKKRDREMRDESREQRLQHVISLKQFARQNTEQEKENKKSEKGPSEQNLAALRSALADVLRRDKEATNEKVPEKDTKEKKEDKKSGEAKPINKIEKRKDDKKVEEKNDAQENSNRAVSQEVPEDVLKSLLEVSDEEVKRGI